MGLECGFEDNLRGRSCIWLGIVYNDFGIVHEYSWLNIPDKDVGWLRLFDDDCGFIVLDYVFVLKDWLNNNFSSPLLIDNLGFKDNVDLRFLFDSVRCDNPVGLAVGLSFSRAVLDLLIAEEVEGILSFYFECFIFFASIFYRFNYLFNIEFWDINNWAYLNLLFHLPNYLDYLFDTFPWNLNYWVQFNLIGRGKVVYDLRLFDFDRGWVHLNLGSRHVIVDGRCLNLDRIEYLGYLNRVVYCWALNLDYVLYFRTLHLDCVQYL